MANAERLSWKKKLILAKLEATPGTAVAPAGTDAILAKNVEITPLAGDLVERELIQPYLGHSAHGSIYTGVHATLSFAIELVGSGAVGTPPAWGGLLKACGMAETIIANQSVAYTPVGAGFSSATLVMNIDGQQQTLAGCRGTYTIDINAEEIPMINFSFTGRYSDPAAVAAIAADVSDYKLAVAANANTTFSLLGNANMLLSSFSYDHANEVIFESLIGSAANNNLAQIVDRAPTASITATAPATGTLNLIKKSRDADLTGLMVLQMGAAGAAGARVTLFGTRVQVTEPSYTELNQLLGFSATLNFLPSSANNEMALSFT